MTEKFLQDELGLNESTLRIKEGPNWSPTPNHLAEITSLNFSILQKDEETLIPLLFSMFKDLGIMDKFTIDEAKLW